MTTVRTLAVAALLTLTCAACGGASSNDEAGTGQTSESPTTPSVSPSASGTPFPTAEAQSAANAAVLSISDLPAGWSTSKDQSDDSDTTEFQKRLADCLGAPSSIVNGDEAAVHVESPDFDSPDGNTTISETLSVDRTERGEQLFEVLHQSNFTECMTDTFGAYIKKTFADSDDPDVQSATLGEVEVGQLSAGQYGDDTVALRVTVPIEISGVSTSVYLDVLYVRQGNAVENMTFEGVGTPVDPQTTARFTRLATRKLTQQDLPTG
jgi:hypothetical protein